jgi:Holliday junction DNA helicase RuvA
MIGRLTGRLAEKSPDHLILDVGGVGYLVSIPLSTFYVLPETESPASLWIHTHVREDTLALYGFLTERERSLFLMLLSVAGIGPRVALTVLSGIPPAELELAEKASRFVSEPAVAPAIVAADDVLSALVNLGYRKAEAERAVESVAREGAPKDFGEYLKLALKRLTGG